MYGLLKYMYTYVVMNLFTFPFYITEEADSILDNELYLLQLPHNLPTLASIDAGRSKSK